MARLHDSSAIQRLETAAQCGLDSAYIEPCLAYVEDEIFFALRQQPCQTYGVVHFLEICVPKFGSVVQKLFPNAF